MVYSGMVLNAGEDNQRPDGKTRRRDMDLVDLGADLVLAGQAGMEKTVTSHTDNARCRETSET